ncbi:hypothetical protein Tco_0370494 [Tanacetum coccineum]
MEVTFPSGSKIKITPKKIREVLGIPMGKKKLKSDSPREYDDELLKAFKLVYLHYTKIDSMVMMQRKWPAIRNWTSQDVVDRENFEMSKGQIGLVEVIEDDDKEDENEKDTKKRKLRELVYETIEEKFQNVLKEKTELEHFLKEYMEMDELFSGDEKLPLYVKKFKEDFTKGLQEDEERAGTSGVGNDDGNEDGADNNEVDVAEENEATEMGIDAEKSVKEAA